MQRSARRKPLAAPSALAAGWLIPSAVALERALQFDDDLLRLEPGTQKGQSVAPETIS
jgi:hypothetical protein